SKEVIREALDKYDNPAILWTGGKDSTLVVWLAKQVAEEEGRELSDLFDVVFIEHGQHFDEVEEFTDAVSDAWGFDVVRARNDDFLEKVDDPFDEVDVDD
ncbi:MAG: phosphoadenosine phosphosulfate reductase family protein, partial [Halobacteria archaeon]|nr:phosphoadenosine phosphosulfate reductase family protein [Halobacteria archaeon]